MAAEAPVPSRGICFSDEPALKPAFRFGDYSNALAGRILSAGFRPFSVGIFGGYGSGKTTLLRSIRRTLDERGCRADVSDKEGPVHCLWFDAWRYAKGSNLFLAFLGMVARDETLAGSPERKRVAMDALRSFVAGVTLNLGFGELDFDKVLSREASLQEERESTLAKAASGFHDIPDHLRGLTLAAPRPDEIGRQQPGPSERRLVVFVDDLDRCEPADAFQMLEMIKSLTDIPGWTWVFALDPRVLNAQVASKYQKRIAVAATEYFEKLFNLTFVLPAPESPMTEETLKEVLYGVGVPVEGARLAADLVTEVAKHSQFLPSSVRQLKRILNNAQTLCAINDDVDLDLIVLLSIMKTRWPLLFGILREAEGSLQGVFEGVMAADRPADAPELVLKYRETLEARAVARDASVRALWRAVTTERDAAAIRWVLMRLGLEVDLLSALNEKRAT